MDTVWIRCPACGSGVHVPVSALVISQVPQDGRAGGRVAFGCPACGRSGSVPIDDRLVVDLRGRGCRLAPDIAVRSRHPAGQGRPRSPTPVRPPLTSDDLLDLHLMLQSDDWFDRLRTLVR